MNDFYIGLRVKITGSYEDFELSQDPEENIGCVLQKDPHYVYIHFNSRNISWWFPNKLVENFIEFVEPLEKELFSINSLIEKFFKKEI